MQHLLLKNQHVLSLPLTPHLDATLTTRTTFPLKSWNSSRFFLLSSADSSKRFVGAAGVAAGAGVPSADAMASAAVVVKGTVVVAYTK